MSHETLLYISLALDTILLSFENKEQGKQILAICDKITKVLDDIVVQNGRVRAVHSWFTNNTLGALDQVLT